MSDVCEMKAAIRTTARTREVEVARLAERQHGVVAHRQLIALGFRPGAIQRRAAGGRLHRVHLGVYAVGHRRLSRDGRWMAAVLACGDTALLSHRSAAALWGLLDDSGSRTHVTTARRCHGREGIALHRSRLHEEDRAVRDGIPVTSVARTLLDLAEVVPLRLLQRAIDQAERSGVFDLRAIDRLLERSQGRHGLRPLSAALASHRLPACTRSELERRFLRLCHDSSIPPPQVNTIVAAHEVDMVWASARLVIELDGYKFHRTRADFERDRVRDATLLLAGYRVVRITWRRLVTDPAGVVQMLRALLRQSPETGAARG